MKTSRITNGLGTALALGWLTTATALSDQVATITPLPHLGGGANLMSVGGLNNSGVVVGFSRDTNDNERAFRFSGGVIMDLGTLGGPFSSAAAVNNNGLVTGHADLPPVEVSPGEFNSPQHAFLRNGTMTDLGILPNGTFSFGQFINDNGDVAGLADSGGFTRGFVYRNGQMNDIGSLGSGLSTIDDFNNSGHAVGYSLDANFTAIAFFYDGTSMQSLGTLGGAFSRAWAINDAGVIAGEADNDLGATRAFVYENGTMMSLGTLGGEFSYALDINNAGHVMGYSEILPNDFTTHAFIVQDGVMTDLGTLGGTVSHPIAMNNHGHIIGDTEDDQGMTVPFLYRDGTMVNINSLLPPDSGWVILTAFHINDAGQISGYGFLNGEFSWYLLTLPNDNHPPVAEAGNDQAVECGTAAHLDGSGSTDEDDDVLTYAWLNGTTLLGTNAVLDVSLPRGTHTLTLVVSDECGESDDDTVTVTVNDTIAPNVACPNNQSAPAGVDCQALVPDFASAAVATDACGPLSTRSQSPAAGTPVGLGTHTVTVSVADEAGNVGTCTATFTVIDSTAPIGDCPPARSVEGCSALVPDFRADLLATDNCTPASALVKTQSPAPGTPVTSGTHVITLTVTDAAGNSAVCSTTFTVLGSGGGPSITGPATVTVEAGTNEKAYVPDLTSVVTVSAGCHGPVTVSQNPAAGPGVKRRIGEHPITMTAVDAAGNVATHTITLIVVDSTAPAITRLSVSPRVISGKKGSMVAFSVDVRTRDNCDAKPKARIISITSSEPVTGPGDTSSPDWQITGNLRGRARAEAVGECRVYTITVECRDKFGNVSTSTVTTTVKGKHSGDNDD